MTIQIIGIRKPGGAANIHEAISHYQWVKDGEPQPKLTDRAAMVSWLEKDGNSAFVRSDGRTASCYVNSNGHTKFLQTYADNQWSDNLLSLTEV